jgi:hypothetical protein
MGMSEALTLLREIERFLDLHAMAPSTFGRKSVNDGKLVARLREGGGVTLQTAADIRRFIAARSAQPTTTGAAA